MSIDPLAEKYSYQSPYNFSENRVVDCRELEGLEAIKVTYNNGTSDYRNSNYTKAQQRDATIGAVLMHPVATSQVRGDEYGGLNISSVSGRIARHMTDNENMSAGIGSESNAVRHTLWSATMANQFGKETATDIANAHEGVKPLDNVSIDFSKPLVQNAEYADSVVDILNNEIGRQIGAYMPEGSSQIDIAKQVLATFVTGGLWQTSTDKDGNISVSRKPISDAQYQSGLKTLNTLSENGFNDKDYKKLLND